MFYMRSTYFILFLFFCNLSYTGIVWAQTPVNLINAEFLRSGLRKQGQIQRLIDNVVLEQDGVMFHCDSAYMNRTLNTFVGYSEVYINDPGKSEVRCDSIDFLGNEKRGRCRGHVQMKEGSRTLDADSLDFDWGKSIGYFSNGGILTDTAITLVSKQGYYFANDSLYVFSTDVVVVHEKFTLYTDSLHYRKDTEVATFFGPTTIVSDSNRVYCENGWYDTRQQIADFRDNAYYDNTKNQLKGQRLYYEREKGIGQAYTNVELIDTANNVVIKGNYALYNEITEYSLVTDSALFIQVSEGDTMFLHADTLVSQLDTADARHISAYRGVRIFRPDFQGKCDSLYYSGTDSLFRMYYNPVLWADERQLSGNFVELQTKNRKPQFMLLKGAAFIVNQEDSTKFGQIKGLNMNVWFREGDIRKLLVEGDAISVYYTREDSNIFAVNKGQAVSMTIYFDQKELERIVSYGSPDNTLYPIEHTSDEEMLLPGFQWFDEIRPKKWQDVFGPETLKDENTADPQPEPEIENGQ